MFRSPARLMPEAIVACTYAPGDFEVIPAGGRVEKRHDNDELATAADTSRLGGAAQPAANSE
ncbi:hypothetical protein [Mycobacterium syngnathidarum]|uniref:hypothetical protein n=1 Tax=Mycobacterium syngnathidarum TaxID=1908205 RepID=UPI001056A684|nr:hypothetical protein [Mycobacterium syngnathidarum]